MPLSVIVIVIMNNFIVMGYDMLCVCVYFDACMGEDFSD